MHNKQNTLEHKSNILKIISIYMEYRLAITGLFINNVGKPHTRNQRAYA